MLSVCDNSESRLHNVFFYGLYMDPEILRSKGVEPRIPRKAKAKGYLLRIGNKATLLRDETCQVYGMLYSLTHAEIDRLYRGSGLDEYVAEALNVEADKKSVAALCCNLLVPPAKDETNPEYETRLRQVMAFLELPVTF